MFLGLHCIECLYSLRLARYALCEKDRERNAAYYRALKAVVTNTSVVLDVGSGSSGLLAMMAARLGARRVFTVEANEVVRDPCGSRRPEFSLKPHRYQRADSSAPQLLPFNKPHSATQVLAAVAAETIC